MKHRLTHLLTALFAALAAALLLAACSPKPLEERDLVAKLRRSDAFLPGRPKIDSCEVLDRSTDRKKGTDTLTVTVRVEDGVEAELTYDLTLTEEDGEWRLTNVDRAEDGPWTIEGPSRRQLQFDARERDAFLREHPDADVTLKTTSEDDDFDPEDGTYTKTLTLSLTAPYDVAIYNATVKATYALTEDGWELDRWKTTSSGFAAGEAPTDDFYTGVVRSYCYRNDLPCDTLTVIDRGEDLEAGTAWAEVAAATSGLLRTDVIYRVDAVYKVDDVLGIPDWQLDGDSINEVRSEVTWESDIFPIYYTNRWASGFKGGLTVESANGTTMRVISDMTYSGLMGYFEAKTSGTVTVTLEKHPEGDGYVFTLDGVPGDFYLDPSYMNISWFFNGLDDTWSFSELSPTFNASPAPGPAEPEPLPAAALNHWDFESADGLTAVHQIPRPAVSELTGVIPEFFDIAPSCHEPIFADGPVGKALYLDGEYGIKLDMKAPTDDSYTIAFWYNGDRFFTYGPIVTMGRNIGMAASADPASAVAWFNFTQGEWGPDSTAPQITPTVWNRNSSIGTDVSDIGVWPWVGPDTVYGKKEWAHVALVVDGVRYTAEDGMDRIGAKLYVNGVLMSDANSENLAYQGVSPEIFRHIDTAVRGLEAYIGVNYWDGCYKGFIDELFVFDEALTPGQVTALYEMGNPTVPSAAPAYTGPTDD